MTTDNAGAFSLKVGLGSSTSGTFNQINWSNGDKYIQSEFDFNDGSGFQLSGTSQILSVPFALYAGNGSKWKIKSDSSTYYNSGKVGIRTTTPRSFLDVISNEGNSQYTLNLSSTHSQGQAGLAAWNDIGGWLKVSLLGSQVTDGAAFGQSGEGTVQILSNMTGARDMLLGT
ncbi:MAG: hypothetical protein JST14_00245, partial [Bacteroidetes bacterium]|nr:hypothetical protein [Bacteroidota bacterium]